jgi:hypothetical protein
MRIRRSRFKRLVILASLLLTASAPMTVSGCIDGNSSGPSCRENGESCLGDSECCSGFCKSDNLMGPGGDCTRTFG